MEREVVTLSKSGVRIVFDPMPHLGSAAVGVWTAMGCRNEAPAQNGIAHLIEHMAFKGSGGRNAIEIAEAVESRGASINAGTEYERTGYFVRCLAPDAPAMADIALSLMFDPDTPEDEFEREKDVVLQEIGEAADQPDDLVYELAQEATFPDHPLGRPILGTPETLAALTRNDLLRFPNLYRAPNRTIVSIAGAFDRPAIEAMVRARFENHAGKPVDVRHPPKIAKAGVRTASRPLEQTHLVLGKRAPSAMSDERFSARIFAEIYGGGMASRLFQELRDKRGLAYTVDASIEQYSDCGRFTVYAGCAPKDAVEVSKLSVGIWSDLAAKGPTPLELDRAKAVMKAGFVMAIETPSARAGSAAHELLTFDRLVPVEEVLARIDAVTADEVRRIAAEALAKPGIAAAVGPKAGLAGAEAFVSAAN